MSEHDDPTPTSPRPRGRSLRDPRPTGSIDAEPQADEELEHHGSVPPEPPVEYVPASATPMGRKLAAAAGPKVMVWNKTEGLRLGVCNIPLLDARGAVQTDGAGMTRYAEQIRELLKPGINLVPLDTYRKIRPGLEEEVKLGEIEVLGDDPQAVALRRLIPAIESTGTDDVLHWIAERDRRADVAGAIEGRKAAFHAVERPRQTG